MIRLFKNVPKVLIPAFWFSQTVEMNEALAKSAKVLATSREKNSFPLLIRFYCKLMFQIAIQLPSIGLYLAFGVSGLGFILLAVGAILTYTRSWSSYENLDDELTTDSTSNS